MEQLSSSTDMDGCKGSATRVIRVTVGFYSKLSAMKVSVKVSDVLPSFRIYPVSLTSRLCYGMYVLRWGDQALRCRPRSLITDFRIFAISLDWSEPFTISVCLL